MRLRSENVNLIVEASVKQMQTMRLRSDMIEDGRREMMTRHPRARVPEIGRGKSEGGAPEN